MIFDTWQIVGIYASLASVILMPVVAFLFLRRNPMEYPDSMKYADKYGDFSVFCKPCPENDPNDARHVNNGK